MAASAGCLFVLPCGMPVTLALELKGIITAVCIRDDRRVTYEVSWWDKGDHKTAWLEPCEIEAVGSVKLTKIGFHDDQK